MDEPSTESVTQYCLSSRGKPFVIPEAADDFQFELMYGISYGNLEMIQSTLARGAHPMGMCADIRQTGIESAIRHRQSGALSLLLRHGGDFFDVDAADPKQLTAQKMAAIAATMVFEKDCVELARDLVVRGFESLLWDCLSNPSWGPVPQVEAYMTVLRAHKIIETADYLDPQPL